MSTLSEIVESLTDVEVEDDPVPWNLSAAEVEWLVEAGVRMPLVERSTARARKAKRSYLLVVSDYVQINNEERLALLRALGFRVGVWGRYRDLVERVYETRIDCPLARARGPPRAWRVA